MFRSLATYRSEYNFGCLFKAVKPILTQWGLSGALYDLYYTVRGEGNSWEALGELSGKSWGNPRGSAREESLSSEGTNLCMICKNSFYFL